VWGGGGEYVCPYDLLIGCFAYNEHACVSVGVCVGVGV